ncbi:MAG: hypothetical protein QXH02_03240 [Desulfurococcaceae archaeon]
MKKIVVYEEMIRLPWADLNMFTSSTRRGKVTIRESKSILVKLNLIIGELLPVFYEYNNKIKHTGFYLKPVHISTRRLQDGAVIKYYYYGRYWYRLERDPAGKLKWIYVGKDKPLHELPDPPHNPLEGVVVKKYSDTIEIVFAGEELFREIYNRLLGK